MTVANIIVITFLVYYSLKTLNIFIGGVKENKLINKQLDILRLKKIKTVSEQKEFINLLYPKKIKHKYTFNDYFYIFIMVTISVGIFCFYNYIFNYFKIVLNIYFVILLVCIFPLIISIIFNYYGMNDKNTLYNMFRRAK